MALEMDQRSVHMLFVYGALLDPAECRLLLGREVEREAAHLDGFYRGRRRYFFVASRDGGRVDGAILFGLNDHDFSILDEYEEVPSLYTRELIEAIGAGGAKVRCWIYLPTGWERG
jgi:gamma-glutamylcyclotransferase (GGCT)/AIG2-like uncharacterized protein YtfP